MAEVLSPSIAGSIDSEPSWERYKQRESALAALDHASLTLPDGFPSQLEPHSLWQPTHQDLEETSYSLSRNDVEELENAVLGFKKSALNLNRLSPLTFRLPTLGPKLRKISANIHDQHGVAIVQGLDPDKYTPWENAVLFGGLSSHIGDRRGIQSGTNAVLTHVKAVPGVPDVRPLLTKGSLPFHNDPGEVVGLYIVEPSKAGGETLIAPARVVYNEIAQRKPHLVSVLANNEWPHWTDESVDIALTTSLRAKTPVRKLEWPLLFLGNDGLPFFGFSRYALTGCPASPRPDMPDIIPPLSMLQADALDTVEFIASNNCVALPQRKGDMQFFSNRMYLHARTAYDDGDTPGQSKRHLMRIGMIDSEFGHPLHPALEDRWGRFWKYPLDEGKWLVDYELPESFVSSHLFESQWTDETGQHSNGT